MASQAMLDVKAWNSGKQAFGKENISNMRKRQKCYAHITYT